MKFFRSFLLLTLIITASEGHKSKEIYEETSGKELKNDDTLVYTVRGNTEFAINVYKFVTSASSQAKDSPAKNVVFSPLSMSAALSMLSLGARSKTHQEIWKGLSLNNTHLKKKEVYQAYSSLFQMLKEPKSSLKVDIGNAVFIVDTLTLRKTFKDDVKHFYHAEIRKTNFNEGAEKEINEYVKKKTEGKIEELVKDLAADTKMALINYVLFKGKKRAVAVGADYHILSRGRVRAQPRRVLTPSFPPREARRGCTLRLHRPSQAVLRGGGSRRHAGSPRVRPTGGGRGVTRRRVTAPPLRSSDRLRRLHGDASPQPGNEASP